MASKQTLLQAPRPRATVRPTRRLTKLLWLTPGILLLGWFSYRAVRAQVIAPQAILVLGGDLKREEFAADFAQQHPGVPVWISGGSNPEFTEAVFGDAQIPRDLVHIDRSAVDTVTNFTTLAETFQTQRLQNVYLITSDYHMPRSQLIGEIVFGSRGISLRPVPVASSQTQESWVKVLRDGGRAVLWVLTGRTGSTLHQEGRFKYQNR